MELFETLVVPFCVGYTVTSLVVFAWQMWQVR